MKKLLALALCAAMVLSVAACGGNGKTSTPTTPDKKEETTKKEETSKPAEVREVKFSCTPAETAVIYETCVFMAEKIEEYSEGRFDVTVYANEQLGGGDLQKAVEMVFTGIVDMDAKSVINMTGFEPKLTISMMPWIYSGGFEEVDSYLRGGGTGQKAYEELIAAKGSKVIGMAENGFRQLTNNVKAVHAPADMARLKIRVPPITMYTDLFKLFGSDPVTMNFGEVFTALQQGTLDGQENPIDTIRAGQFKEVQKYLTIWDYSYDPYILHVSQKFWDSLSPEDQELFLRVGEEGAARDCEVNRSKNAGTLEDFKAAGMEINELTKEEKAAFQEAAAPIYDMYREKIGDDVFAAFGYTFN